MGKQVGKWTVACRSGSRQATVARCPPCQRRTAQRGPKGVAMLVAFVRAATSDVESILWHPYQSAFVAETITLAMLSTTAQGLDVRDLFGLRCVKDLGQLMWDRRTELAHYTKIQTALETTLYLCDPHSPWQRGTNENTNRLLRFWFEKARTSRPTPRKTSGNRPRNSTAAPGLPSASRHPPTG